MAAARPKEETLDGVRATEWMRASGILLTGRVCSFCLLRPVLFDISQLLQTGLDRETLAVLVGLTESGVNPEALAAVVRELRREAAVLAQPPSTSQPRDAATVEAAAFLPPRS